MRAMQERAAHLSRKAAGSSKSRYRCRMTASQAQDGVRDCYENRADAETGTMRARAILDNPDDLLAPGLFGRVNVPGSLPYEGILIPDQALVADQYRRLAICVDDAAT